MSDGFDGLLFPEPDSDGNVVIPPEFWRNFTGEPLKVRQEGPLVKRCLYHDRQTYEDWLNGNFAVWFRDGRSAQVSGVMVNRDDLMRLFPPRDAADA